MITVMFGGYTVSVYDIGEVKDLEVSGNLMYVDRGVCSSTV